MDNGLTTLIGKAIHHCGALEFFVNNEIRNLAKDELLARKVTTFPFNKRIDLLKELLKERSSLESADISSLCNDLEKISEIRNQIAHNPIVSDSANLENSFILLVRNAPDKVEKMFAKDLKTFIDKTSEVMQRMVRLLPNCVNCEKKELNYTNDMTTNEVLEK
jgi:hypothetical protein